MLKNKERNQEVTMKFHHCQFCSFESHHKWVVRRHLWAHHKEDIKKEQFPVIIDNSHNVNSNNSYALRLIENFKLFISGPSR